LALGLSSNLYPHAKTVVLPCPKKQQQNVAGQWRHIALSIVHFPGEKMETKLYVGNLTYGTTEADLQTLFAQSGVVKSVQIIKDRDSGQSKGFGFVEMTTQEEAQNAIKALSGKEVDGRALTVNLARPREERGGGGGRGGRGQGGGGGRRDW
jgi:cold-inducible RNA-binding protein